MAKAGAKGCPECGGRGTSTDSRPAGPVTRRRYKCACGARWGTIETKTRDIPPDCRAHVTKVLRQLLQEIHAA